MNSSSNFSEQNPNFNLNQVKNIIIEKPEDQQKYLLLIYYLLTENLRLKQKISQQNKTERALREANQNLQQITKLDSLTNIANRRGFDDYFAQIWSLMTRESAPISLILCDIDCFKFYNDTYGHVAGDKCLHLVAQVINRTVKRPADLVARYGGEEFAVILPRTDIAGAIQIANQIQGAIRQLKIVHERSFVNKYLTLSLGVAATIPKEETSPEKLISTADLALYKAKNKGRNCVINYRLS